MPPTSPTSFARAVITVGALTVGATLAVAAPATAHPAAIPGNPHSATVIERAGAALAAHDVFSWAQTPDSFAAYVVARHAAADAVSFELAVDPLSMRDAWAKADLEHQKAVLTALTQIDRPYVTNTSDPAVGFDCSGLTAFAWGRAGLTITRQSSAQIQAARPVEQSAALAGDLAQYPGHIMMYLGVDDAIVHAANSRTDIAIGFLSRDSRFGDPTG